MAGEVNKIKFTLNGKEITLKEGECLKNDKRQLKALGSLWDEISKDNKLDKNELDMFKNLDKLLNKNGEWKAEDMANLANEFNNQDLKFEKFIENKLNALKDYQERLTRALINPFNEDIQVTPQLVVDEPKNEAVDEKKDAEAEYQKAVKDNVKEYTNTFEKVAEDMEAKALDAKAPELKGVDEERLARIRKEEAEEQRKAELEAKYSATHTVAANETLGFIAKKILQDAGNARPTRAQIMELVAEIAEMNGIDKNTYMIRVGQKIRVPADVSEVETLKPKAPPQPEEKVPTADEMMEQLTLPDRVADIKDLYNNAKTEKDFAALKDKIDAKLAPYVLTEISFEGIKNPVELNNDRVKIAKNVLMMDLVEKLLHQAKELGVEPGKDYTLLDIKTMPTDKQKGIIPTIARAIQAEEAKTNYEIKPGKYVTKDEQGRVTRDLRVEVSDGGFYVYEQKYNAERGWVENHYDKYIGFDKPGVYTQYEPHGKTVKAEHTVVEENGRLKVITRTPIEGGHKTETWYVDDGRKNTPQINTLRAELRELNKKLGEVNEKLASEPERKYEHTNTKLALEKQIKAIEEKIASLQEK